MLSICLSDAVRQVRAEIRAKKNNGSVKGRSSRKAGTAS
jgi:hypothetical protein